MLFGFVKKGNGSRCLTTSIYLWSRILNLLIEVVNFFKWANPGLFRFIFVEHFTEKNWRLLWYTNSDRWSRREARWPLRPPTSSNSLPAFLSFYLARTIIRNNAHKMLLFRPPISLIFPFSLSLYFSLSHTQYFFFLPLSLSVSISLLLSPHIVREREREIECTQPAKFFEFFPLSSFQVVSFLISWHKLVLSSRDNFLFRRRRDRQKAPRVKFTFFFRWVLFKNVVFYLHLKLTS